LVPSFQGSLEPRESRRTPARAEQTFDITKPAYQSNTYAFTEEELWAIEDMKNELQRRYGIKVTKYNLLRLGAHCLIEDFHREGEKSFVVERARSKNK